MDGDILVLGHGHGAENKLGVAAGPPAEGVQRGGRLPANGMIVVFQRAGEGINRPGIAKLAERSDGRGADIRLAIFQRGDKRRKTARILESTQRPRGGETNLRFLIGQRFYDRLNAGGIAVERHGLNHAAPGFRVAGLKPLYFPPKHAVR